MTNQVVHIVSPTESLITTRGKRHPNLANYLVDRGVKVNYLTSTINHAEKRVFDSGEIHAGARAAPYPISFISAGLYRKNISLGRVLWNWIFSFRIFIALFKSVKAGDIVIFPSRPSELLLVSLLIKKLKGVKLLLDVEDIWPDAFVVKNPLVRWAFNLYCNFFNRIAVPGFSHSFYVASSFLPWVRRYSKELSSEFTPLGVSAVEVRPDSKKLYKGKLETITLFYGGTLTLQFDIMPVLKAVASSRRTFKLVLAGDDGSGERFKEVMEFAQANSLSCVNHGVLSKAEFLNQLKAADISIIPMVSGGLPKKYFDAVGSYKPILCLGEGAVADEVRQFGLGWVCGFDDIEVRQVLENIQSEGMSKAINNINKNVDRYSEESSMRIIHKVIMELL